MLSRSPENPTVVMRSVLQQNEAYRWREEFKCSLKTKVKGFALFCHRQWRPVTTKGSWAQAESTFTLLGLLLLWLFLQFCCLLNYGWASAREYRLPPSECAGEHLITSNTSMFSSNCIQVIIELYSENIFFTEVEGLGSREPRPASSRYSKMLKKYAERRRVPFASHVFCIHSPIWQREKRFVYDTVSPCKGSLRSWIVLRARSMKGWINI